MYEKHSQVKNKIIKNSTKLQFIALCKNWIWIQI